METIISLQATVPDKYALQRLDRVAADLFPDFSRSRLQGWIRSGEMTVDGELRRPRDKVQGGEEIEVSAALQEVSFGPEPVAFTVLYEDADVIVVDKPVGLVVHPGAGNASGTLMNGLLYRYEELSLVPRAGIVHRLDKETSGLMVVARNPVAQNSLVQQLQDRSVNRIYEAIAYGRVERNGRISAPIGRNPNNRVKMAVLASGKEAITRYELLHQYPEHSHVQLSLETGRTHQIRVHMSHLGFPLVGDPTYGGTYREPANKHEVLVAALQNMKRQALHARRLSFQHPGTGESVSFESPLPGDVRSLIDALESVE